MAQGFYTLDEAAGALGMTPDELNRMAQRREVRAFADRGTWRFRTQDIDELAQQRGAAPAADLGQGEDVALGADAPIGLDAGHSAAAGLSASAGMKATSGLGPIGTGRTGMKTSSGLGAPAPASGNLGMPDDISFEDISLDELPMDEPPKPHTTGAGSAQAGLRPLSDEDLIPFDNDPARSGQNLDVVGMELPPEMPGSGSASSSAVALGELDVPSSSSQRGPALPSTLKPSGDSDVRLVLEKGSFEFDVTGDSQGRVVDKLSGPPSKPPSSHKRMTSTKKTPSPKQGSGRLGEHDSDVRVDFDSSTIDDSMVSMGGAKPDSDVRLESGSMGRSSGALGGQLESLPTEEIDLDAELQQADDASQARHGKTKPQPPHRTTGQQPRTKSAPPSAGRTIVPPQVKGTMLPTSSPFELSEDDLELPAGLDDSADTHKPLGSEFELTLAPEDDMSPLALGDDEDVDLGGALPKSDLSSQARAELSGINLHDPADSGISLEKGGGSSDSVDFELTIDDEASSGPKTIKGQVPKPDSDSEFELTLEDSSGSIPAMSRVDAESASGDEKDIFETDFDLPALEDESASQAVALEESDTDLESSDFDLALEESGDSAAEMLEGDSASEVVVLDDEEEPAVKPRRSRVSGLSDSDSADLLGTDLTGVEEEAELDEEDELSPAEQTIPAAQAEWGLYPIFMMVPCVLIMFVAGLMTYELLHGMWGYHQSSKPSGLVVKSMAKIFTEDLPKDAQ